MSEETARHAPAMSRGKPQLAKTWAALLTPALPAAIATIALRGALAEATVAASFRAAGARCRPLDRDEARYGQWHFHGAERNF